MAKIDKSWSEDYIKKVEELEKQLGHSICGYPTEDGTPCTRWPSSVLGRCLKHADPDTISKVLTGAEKEEVKTSPKKQEVSIVSEEVKQIVEKAKEMEKSPSPSSKELKFWIILNIFLFLLVIALSLLVFKPEFLKKIKREDEKLYTVAEKYYENREVLKALESYKKLIEKYPDSPYYEIAVKRRKECLDFLKAENLKAIIKLKKDKPEVAVYKYQLALLYMEKGKLVQAIELFNDIIKNYPDFENMPWVYYKLSVCYQNLSEYSTQNFKKAIEVLTKLVEKFPESTLVTESIFAIGYIYQNKLNNVKKAMVYYNLLIEKYPQSKWAQEAKAIIQMLSENKSGGK